MVGGNPFPATKTNTKVLFPCIFFLFFVNRNSYSYSICIFHTRAPLQLRFFVEVTRAPVSFLISGNIREAHSAVRLRVEKGLYLTSTLKGIRPIAPFTVVSSAWAKLQQ